MSSHDHAEPTRRVGFWRWFWLGLMILGAVLAFGVGGIFKPAPPAVVLPAEPAWPSLKLFPLFGQEFFISNTMLSAFIVALLLVAVVSLVIQPFARSGKLVPEGGYNLIEMAIEMLWDMAEQAAGSKWAKDIFPITATIFIVVLSVNLFGLVPIHETIGYTKVAHGSAKGYQTEVIGGIHLINGGVQGTAEDQAAAIEASSAGHEGESHEAETPAEGEAVAGETEHYWGLDTSCPYCEVVPSLRRASTDLNFTLALALLTMIIVQVMGVRALGLDYFSKFFNLKTIIDKPFFGLMDFIVSLLELISELAKNLSFSLRLFGNMFAGGLLLAILGSLTAFFVPGLLVGLEVAVGAIQAYVFSALALTFISQATVSHSGEGH